MQAVIAFFINILKALNSIYNAHVFRMWKRGYVKFSILQKIFKRIDEKILKASDLETF